MKKTKKKSNKGENMLNITNIKYRKEPVKYSKMQHFEEKNNVVNRKCKKIYNYYICDFCGEEIKINVNHQDDEGGIAVLPNSLTKCGNLRVVLHNKCINKALKQLEK